MNLLQVHIQVVLVLELFPTQPALPAPVSSLLHALLEVEQGHVPQQHATVRYHELVTSVFTRDRSLPPVSPRCHSHRNE